MKKYIPLLLLVAASCNEAVDTKEEVKEIYNAATVKEERTDTLCYLMTEGLKNQDTNAIKLYITGDNVMGDLMYLPYEKDASIGVLNGKKTGDTVNATWSYMQEGGSYSLPVAFLIKGNSIFQNPPAVNEKGEPYLPADAPFQYEFRAVDCNVIPLRNH